MIVVRCPLRVSLFGGGSDYPAFSSRHPSCVVGGTVDKYLYINVNPMPAFARERFRLTYRKTESVNAIPNIDHPIVRTMLEDLEWTIPVNIATMADVPGGSGMGSSSAFTVALRASLAAFRGESLTPRDLATYAIQIERVLLNEPGGIQDQLYPAFGGFRSFRVEGWNFESSDPLLCGDVLEKFSTNFLLAYTGETRSSQGPAARTQGEASAPSNFVKFAELARIAETAAERIVNASSVDELLEITEDGLQRGWHIKASLHTDITPEKVHEAVARGFESGARAGKLMGSGGSGFVLFLIEPSNHARLINAFPSGYVIPVKFTEAAMQIYDLSSEASGVLRDFHRGQTLK